MINITQKISLPVGFNLFYLKLKCTGLVVRYEESNLPNLCGRDGDPFEIF